jgi:hypothetical protein
MVRMMLTKKVVSFCTFTKRGTLNTTKKSVAIRSTPTSSVRRKWCEEINSFTKTHIRSRRRSGHDTENAALRIAYTEINESADPEKYAIAKVRKAKILCSVLDAVFCDMIHSRRPIATATIDKYTVPRIIVSVCPASGRMRRSKINPPRKRRVFACRKLSLKIRDTAMHTSVTENATLGRLFLNIRLLLYA